jgi:proteasome accessory factor A
MCFLEAATSFVERGMCDGFVPRAREIVALWRDTLAKLAAAAAARDPAALTPLAPRLDWVLKFQTLTRVRRQRPKLAWDSPELAHLDRIYGSLDPSQGLYWAYERSGGVERVVTDAAIEHFVHQPPEDTRAWTRAMLLRRAPAEALTSVDWDELRFRLQDGDGWPRHHTLALADPLAFTRRHSEPVLRRAANLNDILDALSPRLPDSGPVVEPPPEELEAAQHKRPVYPLTRRVPVDCGTAHASEQETESPPNAPGDHHERA